MRKRHDYDKDKERLENLHYDEDNIITKSFLSEEYPNDITEEPRKNKVSSFYINYKINVPVNSTLNEMSKERI